MERNITTIEDPIEYEIPGVNQEEGKTSSPFAVNALANARTRFVLEEVNRLAPPFVIHLGDIV